MKKLLSCCEGGQLKENNVKETSPAVEAKRLVPSWLKQHWFWFP